MKQKTLQLDILSGISGDMALGVLAGLGAPLDELADVLSTMLETPVKLSTETIMRAGIACNRLVIEAEMENAPFRHFTSIKKMIEKAHLSRFVQEKAIAAFYCIAEAEAEMHASDIEKVHFHEVGAVDTVIDIVGFAWCLEKLNIQTVRANHAVCGCGTVKTAHGILPVPAPATARILTGIPMKRIEEPSELTTPTGAALLKTFVTEYTSSFSGTVEKAAYATGTKDLQTIPNMLRGMLVVEQSHSHDHTILMETNIDDMSGEQFGDLFTRLYKAGAIDVFYTPVFGKKQRPLYQVSILTDHAHEHALSHILFHYSTTAGIRKFHAGRLVMDREMLTVSTPYGVVRVKKLTYDDIVKFAPEWDDCVSRADEAGVTPRDVYTAALNQ